MMMNELDKLEMLTVANLQDNFDRICSEVAKVWYVHKPWYQLASLELWACRGGVQQSGTQCGHAEGEFCSWVWACRGEVVKLGVGMQRGSSAELCVGMQSGSLTVLNWVWACRGWVWACSLELAVGMQRGSLTVLNWAWSCRGRV